MVKKHNEHKTIIRTCVKLRKTHKAIAFCQEAWLNTDIDINTELRKVARNDFQKGFYKSMNNAVFGKRTENVRKHSDVKLLTTNKKRIQLVSNPNYHTKKMVFRFFFFFFFFFFAIEMKKKSKNEQANIFRLSNIKN